MTDEMIRADSRQCSRPKCPHKGYRWIAADPDIPAFVLCEKHCLEFQYDLLNRTKKQKVNFK